MAKAQQITERVGTLDPQAWLTSELPTPELKKEMKITAVKAAREKAIYLSEAVGEHIGQAITINDPVEIDNTPRPYYANMTMKLAEDNAAPALDVDFKKIKVRFEVSVVFGLQ